MILPSIMCTLGLWPIIMVQRAIPTSINNFWTINLIWGTWLVHPASLVTRSSLNLRIDWNSLIFVSLRIDSYMGQCSQTRQCFTTSLFEYSLIYSCTGSTRASVSTTQIVYFRVSNSNTIRCWPLQATWSS